ncbi:hypothetical protein OG265_37080 (plasmid) [Streptomyces sp. NBC_01208]|nr:hypothetical protein OG265_37080 [Streptomyces sp. NBC_01208]
MDTGAVAAALDEARLDARQASRHEDLADDVRGPAELAEWERIEQLLAAAPPGTVYDPDTDPVVRAELEAEAAAAPPGKPSCAKRCGSRPAPTSSRRCASSAPWSRPSPAPGTKPSVTS